jgi:hypothetical protein
MLFALNNIYYLQGLHPYHVQRVQALQPNDYIRRQEFCEWVIQKCVNPLHFLRIVLFTDEAGFTHNDVLATTPIFNTNPGRYSKFCKDSGQSTSKDRGMY